MAERPEDSRWAGRVDAELEAVKNELLPLKSLPTHMAVVLNTMERIERQLRADRETREKRDEEQDTKLTQLKEGVDKSNSRRATLALWIPVLIALIYVASAARPG